MGVVRELWPAARVKYPGPDSKAARAPPNVCRVCPSPRNARTRQAGRGRHRRRTAARAGANLHVGPMAAAPGSRSQDGPSGASRVVWAVPSFNRAWLGLRFDNRAAPPALAIRARRRSRWLVAPSGALLACTRPASDFVHGDAPRLVFHSRSPRAA